MPDPPERGSRLAFPVPGELTRETVATIDNVRRDAGEAAHVTALIETVLKLTEVGLEEYFLRPLERAEVGMIAIGTAKVGIATARRGITVIVTKVIRGMSEDQLRSVADSMENMWIRE